MHHPFLVGDKIYLRGLEEGDLEGNYFQWFNDQDNDVFTSHAMYPNTPQRMRDFFQRVTDYRSCRNDLVLAIISRENDQHIGNIGLHQINWVDRHARLSIIIGERAAQSKGYGTEAVRLLVDYAFVKLNLHRIGLGVHEDNLGAIRAYQKVGFVEEGRFRDHALRGGRYRDTVCMSILNAADDGETQ